VSDTEPPAKADPSVAAAPPVADTPPAADVAQAGTQMSGNGVSSADAGMAGIAAPASPVANGVQSDATPSGDHVRSLARAAGVDAQVPSIGAAARTDAAVSGDGVSPVAAGVGAAGPPVGDAVHAAVSGDAESGVTAEPPVGEAAQDGGAVSGDRGRSADVAGSVNRRAPFGEGQPDGVLPGDHRTADEVEAGIVSLWRHYGATHDQEYRDRLMLHYAPLVKYVAGRVGTGLPAHVDVADLVQSGIFGLADAIEKFEPERGLKFETYAMLRIKGAILDELRSQDWVPRSVRGRARDVERALERLGNQLQRTPTDIEIANELQIGLRDLRDLYAQFQLTSVVALDELMVAGRGDVSLAETLPDEAADDPAARLVDQVNRRQLADAIAQLEDRDRVVVTLYYFENLTLAEIGRVLGVTESRVCQLHTRAVLRLRTKLAEHADA
jgi:RNA polymerase sigma factor for flagellar operon FliA